MRLARVHIKNFRSIADLVLELDPRCRILVGINESGKSNILKALSLLDPDKAPTPADLRDFAPDEDPNQEAFVRFVFTLDREERFTSYETALKRVAMPKASMPIATYDGAEVTLAKLFDSRHEGLYVADLRMLKKRFVSWGFGKPLSLNAGWMKPSPSCPQHLHVQASDGSTGPLRGLALVHPDAVDRQMHPHLVQATVDDLTGVVHKQINALVEGKLPACVFWAYDESHLLPSQLNLDHFAQKPSICLPLKHMFALADLPDVAAAIADAKRRPNGLRNLLNRVADRATKHVHSVWKDYKGIRLELAPNGSNVDASVRDEHNLYDMPRRSDGFKRFVAFLLMVSARVKTHELIDTLYLHDEPDTSLHPSGARYLRDELIKISKNNYVVFSTHSIFMIDRELLRRHLIVEKHGEVTRIREVDESNIVDEEVIYNALGHSIFENLKERNIIFEGWRDKLLFQVALRHAPARHKNIKLALQNVGVCHARGVKDIARITPMLELAQRRWIVVSDADKPAKEQQRLYRGEGPWYRYDELLPRPNLVTGEDFIKADAFRPVLKRIASEKASLPDVPIDALRGDQPKLAVVRAWLENGGVAGDELRQYLERLKEELYADLRPSHIEDSYFDFLEALSARFSGTQAAA